MLQSAVGAASRRANVLAAASAVPTIFLMSGGTIFNVFTSFASSSRAVVPTLSRFNSSAPFSYIVPRKITPRQHDLVFDEAQRAETWQSDSIPRVPVSLPSSSTTTTTSTTAIDPRSRVTELRKIYPGTYLVFLYKELMEEKYGASIFAASSVVETLQKNSTLSSSLSPDETTLASTPAGRQTLASRAAAAVKALNRACAKAEMEAVDTAAVTSLPGLSAAALEAIQATLYKDVAVATLVAARAVCIAQRAQLRSSSNTSTPMTQQQQQQVEGELEVQELTWLSSLGLGPVAPLTSSSSSASRSSPRIPSELSASVDSPLTSPMSREERRNDTLLADREGTKRMAMEHRDRSEFLSRRKLPAPLYADAPSPQLEMAARALEENPSLSVQDREYMLNIYSTALKQTDAEMYDEKKLLDVAEKQAWSDPQPQWGYYHPAIPTLQDDLHDALAGRGKFSSYRGGTLRQDQITPVSIGEAVLPGTTAGTPLETVEEAGLRATAAEAAVYASNTAATASITAALERVMGLSGVNKGTQNGGGGKASASFFNRLAKSSSATPVAPSPVAPASGTRVQRPRVEEAAAAAAAGKGGKAAAGGKGGKPGAPAAGGKAPAKPAAKK